MNKNTKWEFEYVYGFLEHYKECVHTGFYLGAEGCSLMLSYRLWKCIHLSLEARTDDVDRHTDGQKKKCFRSLSGCYGVGITYTYIDFDYILWCVVWIALCVCNSQLDSFMYLYESCQVLIYPRWFCFYSFSQPNKGDLSTFQYTVTYFFEFILFWHTIVLISIFIWWSLDVS